MSTIRFMHTENTSLGAGVRAATLVVVVGILAGITDHALLMRDVPAQASAAPERSVPAKVPDNSGSFDVPDHLRANAGDVTAPIIGF